MQKDISSKEHLLLEAIWVGSVVLIMQRLVWFSPVYKIFTVAQKKIQIPEYVVKIEVSNHFGIIV